MTAESAHQRIAAQGSQDEKLAAADVVIRNDSTFENTWQQVSAAWKSGLPSRPQTGPLPVKTAAPEALTVDKARPSQASDLAAFITRISGGALQLTSADIMAAFGEKAFFALRQGEKMVGLLGCQVENLVARIDDVYIEKDQPLETAMRLLLDEVESTSRDLQCEASLLFLMPSLAAQTQIWHTLGYEPRTIQNLGVRAWQEAAQESIATGETLFFKQLRVDRVLRPV
jgi:dephospho-CoA kinase